MADAHGRAPEQSAVKFNMSIQTDGRAANKATIITSQLPIEHWHEWIGDPTIADAMLDRLMQHHHRFTLAGESIRKKGRGAKDKADEPVASPGAGA